ncbi:unnamed protein product [Ambrosiozyma monospora]|uniref:Unnamed protein product n=1 Tax=Ambrosiozyma monospora TaxID=43982 RepID=A0ACB5U523_AMBMO|nr:unnamed protein product [Ambrosiozyma monospora]
MAKEGNVDLILFILRNYNVEDEDMMVTHIPLNLLAVLLLYKDDDDNDWLKLMKALLAYIPQRAFLPIEHADPKYTDVQGLKDNYDSMKKLTLERIDAFYDIESSKANGEVNDTVMRTTDGKPFMVADLTAFLLCLTTYKTIHALENKSPATFYESCELLRDLIQAIPSSDTPWADKSLITAIYKQSKEPFNASTAFGVAILFRIISKHTEKMELIKLLKIVVQGLWKCLVHNSGKYQVESVISIWHLEMTIESHYIEAALSGLFLESDIITRIRAFDSLWSHSTQINESDSILTRPLFLILDELADLNEADSLFVIGWINKTLRSGSINRIFKLSSSSLLLKNKFIKTGKFDNAEEDDFELFTYQVRGIQNLITINNSLGYFQLHVSHIGNFTKIPLH